MLKKLSPYVSTLFILAGLGFSVYALKTGEIVPSIPIAMMLNAIGLAWNNISLLWK